MAELEKLGPKYRIALRIARDERFERLRCDHKGVYADDWYVLVLSLMWESLDTWFLETEDIVKW
jgi:rRNA-processing protein FCF1